MMNSSSWRSRRWRRRVCWTWPPCPAPLGIKYCLRTMWLTGLMTMVPQSWNLPELNLLTLRGTGKQSGLLLMPLVCPQSSLLSSGWCSTTFSQLKRDFTTWTFPTYPALYVTSATWTLQTLSSMLSSTVPTTTQLQLLLLNCMRVVSPSLQTDRILLFNFEIQHDLKLPVMYIFSSILFQSWSCRIARRQCSMPSIRASLEAGVQILRKSRYLKAAEKIN